MSVDPLERFRRPGQAPALAPAVEAGGGSDLLRQTAEPPEDGAEYGAHRGADRQVFLTIYARSMTRRPMNAGLKDVIDDKGRGTYLCLLYVDNFAVVLRGRNLLTLAEPLAHGRVEWLLEFDADRWPLPRDKSAPFIEKIEFHDQDAAAALADAARTART